MSMEATAKSPQPSLTLPWKTRIPLSFFSAITDASFRRNGTVNRRLLNLVDFYRRPPTSKLINGVTSHDIVAEEARNLWFRVYVPTENTGKDLPVILFFHGGGFAFLSVDFRPYDDMCRRYAEKVPAVVVSVNYRLAPEHRYPSQHDDCFDVLEFLDDKENRCKSLPENANLKRCFLAGDSAGANLAHHVAQRACEFNFKRLKVIGVVAIQLFFGGEARTDSGICLEGTPIAQLIAQMKDFIHSGGGLTAASLVEEEAMATVSEKERERMTFLPSCVNHVRALNAQKLTE